jgi:hypothetical protein
VGRRVIICMALALEKLCRLLVGFVEERLSADAHEFLDILVGEGNRLVFNPDSGSHIRTDIENTAGLDA